jgi:hypothetical protein
VTFANPAGLLLLGLVLPVLLLHVLKPQRDRVDVSSVYLWKGLAAPVSAARPWQRLRPSLLLFLQLLVVVGLALTVARPVRLTDAIVAEHTVFVIDASGSMAARDGEPDRLADALDTARRLRSELPDGGMASIVAATSRPDVLLSASSDRDAFDDALDQIETSPGSADFADAFALAESLETPDADIGFVLLSDGGLTDAEQRLLPPASVYRVVGESSANRGITRLTIEPRGTGLYAVVALRNSGEDEVTQTLRVDVDGRAAFEDEVTLPARGAQEVVVPDLPAGDRVEAFLEGEDLLDADDHAYAVANRPPEVDVAVVVPEQVPAEEVEGADAVLDAVLDFMPGVDTTWVRADQPVPDVDLVIYDEAPVPAEPPAPFWAIAPPEGAPGVTVTGTVEAPVLTSVDPEDPLVADLDLAEVLFHQSQQLDAPAAQVLVGSEDTPLLSRALFGETTFVYQGFPLAYSTIWKEEAFPVLASRIVTELAGAALPSGALEVGATLPVQGDRDSRVTAPGGTVTEVPAGAPLPRATRVGFWTIETDDQPARTLAVNASARETDIRPAPSLLTEERQVEAGESLPRGQRSVLAWVVLPLLLVVLAEWLLVRRRAGVGRGPPYLFEPRNPAYYPRLFERCGFVPVGRWYGYEMNRHGAIEQLARLERILGRRPAPVRIEELQTGQSQETMVRVHRVLDRCWAGHVGYASLDLDEFVEVFGGALSIMDPGQVAAFVQDGEDAGFAFVYPDYVDDVRALDGSAGKWGHWLGTSRPNRIVLSTAALVPAARHSTAATAQVAWAFRQAVSGEFDECVLSLVIEGFLSRIEEPTREHTLYARAIGA